jgi:hypothetical protein
MEEIINGLRQIKTRVDSGTITTVNGTETLLSKQLASMLEKAINHTRCCEELPTCYSYELDKITQLQQTQASTRHQLDVLRVFANKLGLYDACDYLKEK